MRRRAWMLVLLTGLFIGCGGNPVDKRTDSVSAAIKEPDVPRDVASLFQSGELTQAVDRLTAYIEKSPRDPSLLVLRATARHRLGANEPALADLDRAIELNANDAKLYNNRGFIRLGMEQFQAALNDFDKAVELSPGYKNTYNNRGLVFIAQKRYDDAIAQFNRAIQIDDRYVDAYNNRGFAEFESGQIEKALADFNLVIDLDPDYVNAFNNRGLLRARVGDYENAVLDFTRAMMIDPLNQKYYEHRCEVYQRQGHIDKAVADDNKIIWLQEYHQLTAKVARGSRPVAELTERARHFLKKDDLESALSDLDRALSLDPNSAEALVSRAGIHLRQKSLEDAKLDAETALSISPTQEAYSILGDVYLKLRDYDRAIENFALARRLDPSVAEAYYARSKVLEKRGQPEQARNSLEQALALDPDIANRLQ